jgi:hypothetical protein
MNLLELARRCGLSLGTLRERCAAEGVEIPEEESCYVTRKLAADVAEAVGLPVESISSSRDFNELRIPAPRMAKGNRVLEISERLMGAAFVAGFTSCDRIHQSRTNVCYLYLAGKPGERRPKRKIRISPEDSSAVDDCSAVLGVYESVIRVVRSDGQSQTFPDGKTYECTAFALEG